MFFSKKFLAITIYSAMIASTFSIEWGGLASISEKYNNGQSANIFDFDKSTSETSAEAALWLRIPFSKDGENYFITEGKYNIELDMEDSKSDTTQYIDLDLFKFVFAKQFLKWDSEISISTSVGRFPVSDLSGIVYSQTADGVLFKYKASSFGISVYGAYTGLLNEKTISIISNSNKSAEDDKFYKLAEKFAITSVSLSAPNFIGNQTVSLECLGSFSLEDYSYTRLYGTLLLSGPIMPNLFYEAETTFGYSKFDESNSQTGLLAKGNITYFFDKKDAAAGGSITCASKDFAGFTSQTVVLSQVGLQYNGLIKAGIFGSIKPAKNILTSLSADLIFDSKRSDDNKYFSFAGIQFQGKCSYQIFSDLNMNLSIIQYLDNDISANNKTTIELGATLTF